MGFIIFYLIYLWTDVPALPIYITKYVHAYKEFKACFTHLCIKCSKLTNSRSSNIFLMNLSIDVSVTLENLWQERNFRQKWAVWLVGLKQQRTWMGLSCNLHCPSFLLCEIRDKTISVVKIFSRTGGSKESLQGLSQLLYPMRIK